MGRQVASSTAIRTLSKGKAEGDAVPLLLNQVRGAGLFVNGQWVPAPHRDVERFADKQADHQAVGAGRRAAAQAVRDDDVMVGGEWPVGGLGDVDVVAGQLDRGVGEIGQDSGQQERGGARQRGDRDGAGRVAPERVPTGLYDGQRLRYLATAFCQQATGVGEPQAAPGLFDQRDASVALGRAQLLRDRRRGSVGGPSHGGDRTTIGELAEQVEVPGIHEVMLQNN